MKVLIYNACSFIDPQFGLMIETAEQYAKAGNEVIYACCNGVASFCSGNPSGSKLICAFCRFYQKSWLRKIAPRIRSVELGPRTTPNIKFDYHNFAEAQLMEYRGCDIGFSALSFFVTTTRCSYFDVERPEIKHYLNTLLTASATIADAGFELVEREKPDLISIFNGRFFDNRPFLGIARQKGIDFIAQEVTGRTADLEPFLRISYPNALPHDIACNTNILKELWNLPNESEAEKIRKGREFFERRRHGLAAGDKIYTEDQVAGKLPDGWNPKLKNIVLFNSSDDEFLSIDATYNKLTLFSSQPVGIKYILDHFNEPGYHIYLRVHPNLKNVKDPAVTALYDLPARYPQLTLIPPEDPCSSYALCDAAEKVVVFHSTMGAEAVYWGKPVIMLSAAMYYYLDICYRPESPEQVIEMLRKTLPPKDNFPAIQYAYFLLYRKYIGRKSEFVDLSVRKLHIGPYFLYATGYAKLFGSCALLKFLRTVIYYTCRSRGKNAPPLPIFAQGRFEREKH